MELIPLLVTVMVYRVLVFINDMFIFVMKLIYCVQVKPI